MSFHPHDVRRRAIAAAVLVLLPLILLGAAFFRTQVIEHEQFALQSETNRLRPIPLPAPRGIIYDRHGRVIAESVPGYSVSIIAKNEDSLRVTLEQLSNSIELTQRQIDATVRRYRAMPSRPALVFSDAEFDMVSVLEELRTDFPGLVVQSAPKRYYPDGAAVSAFVGYTAEIDERELTRPEFADYTAGQQVGRDGLERSYESLLRGREGTRFVEVDARNRIVRERGARTELPAESPPPLHTNIDLDLQRHVVTLMDTLQGGIVALDPNTGGVIALHSAPGFNPNRFIGGVSFQYYDSLNTDPRKPLYNKALKGRYEPASTYKLATAAMGLELGLVQPETRMPVACNGGISYGGRYWRCWKRDGHGNVDLRGAIAGSCNVYFYQLGRQIGLRRLLAGGVDLHMHERSGIDLPGENPGIFPETIDYYNETFGPRGWTEGSVAMNLSIGQGENAQTVTNMARFYTALATDGHAATPSIVKQDVPNRVKVLNLTPEQMASLRLAMLDVVSSRGTAGSAQVQGIQIAGKTGTAQNPHGPNHAWFVGFAPVEDPRLVVAVMIEYGQSGSAAARVASSIFERYFRAPTAPIPVTENLE
ncbi:MAG TPA: penicillin-binding protein 2 [Gemmatimonadales bacterium]|nr:penicillin-binding protein 2 [Gemmatimonadales bacterium]